MSMKIVRLGFLILILLLFSGSAGAATFSVGTVGAYLSIQDAIDNAVDGDIIEVAAGVYSEDIDVDRGVVLIGETGAKIKGSVTVIGSNVEINGFEIKLNSNAPSSNGVVLQGAAGVQILGCVIHGYPSHGILIQAGSTNVRIEDSATYDCGTGIGSYSAIGVTINFNSISGNSVYGVYNYTSSVIDATSNWWGDASGPGGVGPGTGDSVGPNVDYSNWDAPTTVPTIVITRAYVTDFSWRYTVYEGETATYVIEYEILGGGDYAKYKVLAKTVSDFGDSCSVNKKTKKGNMFAGKGAHTMILTKKVPRCADNQTYGVSFAGVPYVMEGIWIDMTYKLTLKNLLLEKLDQDTWFEEQVYLVKRAP
jgi:hypothetical protein